MDERFGVCLVVLFGLLFDDFMSVDEILVVCFDDDVWVVEFVEMWLEKMGGMELFV